MQFNLTLSYIKRVVKDLTPHSEDIIELCKSKKSTPTTKEVETELNYSIKRKCYVLTHKGKIAYIKKAKDAQFIHNWYVGTNEDLNINQINEILGPVNSISNHLKPVKNENLRNNTINSRRDKKRDLQRLSTP